jgi:hypothetical protein
MKALVVLYSRSGRTRSVGRQIADRLGADVEEIADLHSCAGPIGLVRMMLAEIRGKPAGIRTPSAPLKDYDLIVVGSPIWGGRAARPVRTYLGQSGGSFSRLALFTTAGGGQYPRALDEMSSIAQAKPIASLELTRADLKSNELSKLVDRFCDSLRSVAS